MGAPAVSIITPTYNHVNFIKECVDSVLAQTFGDWELVIFDNGSTDGTSEIVRQYAGRDKRIRVLRRETNSGLELLAENHNQALRLCSGEFVSVLEGDDFWPPDRLAAQLPSFKRPEVVLSHGIGVWSRDGEGLIYPYMFGEDVKLNRPVGSALKPFLMGECGIMLQTAMVRRTALETIGGFKQRPGLHLVDFPTWMEIALLGEFDFIDKVLGYWRRHGASLTSRYPREFRLAEIKCAEEFAAANAARLAELPADLGSQLRGIGHTSYVQLCKDALLEGGRAEARGLLGEALRTRAATAGAAARFKLFVLAAAVRMNAPFIYRLPQRLFNLAGLNSHAPARAAGKPR